MQANPILLARLSVSRFDNRDGVNIHPSLLPKFGGKHMHGIHVHKAVLAAKETSSGATIHLVDNLLDHGLILAQETVPVEPSDTDETLAARVQSVEPPLMIATLQAITRRCHTD